MNSRFIAIFIAIILINSANAITSYTTTTTTNLIDNRQPLKTLITQPISIQDQEEDYNYTTTPSGLKYVDLVEGIGASPRKGQRLVVHFVGWLEDGKQFDNTYDSNKPFEFVFGTGQVIKGWEEGLATMKANGKRRLVVPPDLGYGAKGSKNAIPPNSTLIFEVELLSIRNERSSERPQ